jgi:hypothetical protein
MYRRMLRQILMLGLMVTLIFLALSACGGEPSAIQTVAGDGGERLGDGGPAKEAGLCWPTDIALDAQGNMYISDGGLVCYDPVVTPFGSLILMGLSLPWRAREGRASPAMAGPPPRHNSISPAP